MSFVFDKSNTFCINLSTSTVRRETMIKRFNEIELDCTFWDASTPSTLVDNFVNNLSGSQCACAQSHMLIWRHVIEHNLPYVFILEDDAIFHKKWKERLDEINPLLKQDEEWHGVFLNMSEPLKSLYSWEVVYEQYLTGGYILSNRGARILLQMYNPELHGADWMTRCLQTRNHCYGFYPWLIIQEGRESTISDYVDHDHAKVVRCLKENDVSIVDNYLIPPSDHSFYV